MKKKTVLSLARATMALAAIVITVYVVLLAYSTSMVRRARAALAKEGRPLTAEEILPPSVSGGENAAPLYESAFRLLESQSVGDETLLSVLADAAYRILEENMSNHDIARIHDVMERPEVEQAVDLVRRAMERPVCRFSVRWDQGPNALLPHANAMRQMTRILGARSLLNAERGDFDSAWRDAEMALRTAEAMRDEPILISQLVRIAQTRTALEVIRKLAAVAPPNDAVASRLMQLLASLEERRPFARAVDGERLLLGEWSFRLLENDMAGYAQKDVLHSLFGTAGRLIRLKPVRRMDYAIYLNLVRHAASRTERAFHEMPQQDEPDIPRLARLTRLIVPAFGGYRRSVEEHIALTRVARTGLALIRHRAIHGSYPDTLESLAPTLLGAPAEDPFTGRPLIYRRADDGFVVYSVGPDGKDNGGAPRSRSVGRDVEYDLPWAVGLSAKDRS